MTYSNDSMAHSGEIPFNMLRSMLFVPALNERFIAKAHTRGAQGLILDLEDSIVAERKRDARAALEGAVATLRKHDLPVLVRVNNQPDLLNDDLTAAVRAGADAVLVPKINAAAMLQAVDRVLVDAERASGRTEGSVRYIVLIEDPLGMLNLSTIACASPRLCGMGFGSEDYARELGVDPTEGALAVPAQLMAIAARAHGLAALGVPGSIGDFNDVDDFCRLVRKGRTMGFTGALGIHPKQIIAINRAFRPTPEEAAYAQRVVDAYEEAQRKGAGAVALEGKMIDAPIVVRARHTLAQLADTDEG